MTGAAADRVNKNKMHWAWIMPFVFILRTGRFENANGFGYPGIINLTNTGRKSIRNWEFFEGEIKNRIRISFMQAFSILF